MQGTKLDEAWTQPLQTFLKEKHIQILPDTDRSVDNTKNINITYIGMKALSCHIYAYFVSCHHEIESHLVCWPEDLRYLDMLNSVVDFLSPTTWRG